MKKTITSSYLAICYADIFDYPLKEEEMEKWQISSLSLRGASKTSDVAISLKKKKIAALPLVARNDVVVEKDGFYCLLGREKIIKLRQERAKFSQQKLLIAQKITKVLQRNPLVKMVAVTGALAMENSAKNDDIDLLIITKKNRVWLTRLLTTLILDLLGTRRKRSDKNFSDKICLNMFLDETTLRIPQKEQNLYTAHEICQVKPLYNQSQTYEKFMLTNLWARKYLPNGVDTRILRHYDITRKKEKAPNILFGKAELATSSRVISKYLNIVLDALELVTYKLQYFYMKKHITRETVTPNRIMFHPKDTSKIVLEEFEKRVKE